MMTTTKSSDTAATATKQSHPAEDDDEKVNEIVEFSSDSLNILQKKLEATNKSILSTLIQHHEEEQKDEKNEMKMKMLHLLHELPLDTETKELINEETAAVSDYSVVAETKDTDKDVSDDDDTADSNEKKIDLDLLNSSNVKVKAHKGPMRRRSSLDFIRPPERCSLLRNSSLNGNGFRSRSLRDVLEDKEADDSSSSTKDSNSMMHIPRRRISRGNSGKRRITPMPMEGLPSRHLPRKSSAKGSGSFRGSLRRLMEDKETTDLGLGESCISLLSSCSLNSSNQRESIDIMDFGVQNDRYSGSSASPSMASSALSLAPSATDGFVGWSRSDSAKKHSHKLES